MTADVDTLNARLLEQIEQAGGLCPLHGRPKACLCDVDLLAYLPPF